MRFLVSWLAEKLEWNEDKRAKREVPILLALVVVMAVGYLAAMGLAYLCGETDFTLHSP